METRNTEPTRELFEPLPGRAEGGVEDDGRLRGAPVGLREGSSSWRRLGKNRGALAGLAAVAVVVALAVLGPELSPYGPQEQDLARRFVGPSAGHPFGTDDFGRDLFARTWVGTRVSLYIAFLAAGLDLGIGVVYGAVSGLFGGRVDGVMQRGIEILNGVPYLVVVVLAMLVFDAGILTITVALVLTGWTYLALLVRGRVMQLKGQEFVLAARSLGAGRFRLITRHLLPNSFGPIVVQLMFTVPTAIFFEAFLSFVGLGLQPPGTSLGALVSDGYTQLRFHPHLLWFPAAVLSLLMIGFNLLADGLRDALDPKMRG